MWHLLLISICFICLPVAASGSDSPRQTTIKVMLNNHPGRFQGTHGQASIGVIGCKFDFVTGKFFIIYPGSDLANFDIHPGDSFLAIEGKSIVRNINWFQDMTRGEPGTYVAMTVLHDGSPINIRVMRKDSRLFAGCNTGSNNYFIWCAGQTKYW